MKLSLILAIILRCCHGIFPVHVASPHAQENVDHINKPIVTVQADNETILNATNKTSNIKSHEFYHYNTPKNDVKSMPWWDYAKHGADWSSGMCQIGTRQSPVDLHVEGLSNGKPKNLKSIFETVLQGGNPQEMYRGWKRGDVVYSYRHFISSLQISRSRKIFRLSVPNNEGSCFGALFTTDKPNLYMATHIELHSPSEHTFEGSANRRQIEMQIWHYYGDETKDAGIDAMEKVETTELNLIVSNENSHHNISKKNHEILEEMENSKPITKKDAYAEPNATTTNQHKPNDNQETIIKSKNPQHTGSISDDNRSVTANESITSENVDKILKAPIDNHHQNQLDNHATIKPSVGLKIQNVHEENKTIKHASAKAVENNEHVHDDTNGTHYENHKEFQKIAHEHHDQKLDKHPGDDNGGESNNDDNDDDSHDEDHDDNFADEDQEENLQVSMLQHPPKSTNGKKNGNKTKKVNLNNTTRDMHDLENMTLLNKYLLDHLHNAATDVTAEQMHLMSKKKARENGAHWGRWAVLSLTFMSEEMEKTKIETLEQFPSEQFMKSILDAATHVNVTQQENDYVGQLNNEQSKINAVDLKNPLNLPSLLMMLETKNLNYFAYDGSFTQPGCEETVRWYVAQGALPISTELMLQMHRLLNPTSQTENGDQSSLVNNYRELQNVNKKSRNNGRVHLVHAYPMEYFIATSFAQKYSETVSSGIKQLCIAYPVALIALVTIIMM
ncbi:bifunctional Alpha carbonic anhydrase domain superfamily/Alpha carbonic anhydrase domain/Carbonic anhydrase [Babesia duncani]|uniref:Bifunctional Alpha carbonic anhydrase domain superfamily/Alpha carbonic anhydrase domain/Carbonic anhydrase n=1 Tax=Babesia duncani TaxID=323732 RepID=A0AAD9PKS3_9APIC|nr:bifunctional Alpha carbonic anhydrase domain superfamily/Alpha carbonic anhydrase domain/Carbonic anhydrase [Babesia duncani]